MSTDMLAWVCRCYQVFERIITLQKPPAGSTVRTIALSPDGTLTPNAAHMWISKLTSSLRPCRTLFIVRKLAYNSNHCVKRLHL